jgi:hypothetical protein
MPDFFFLKKFVRCPGIALTFFVEKASASFVSVLGPTKKFRLMGRGRLEKSAVDDGLVSHPTATGFRAGPTQSLRGHPNADRLVFRRALGGTTASGPRDMKSIFNGFPKHLGFRWSDAPGF